MNAFLLAGTAIVHLALLSYSIGVVRQLRQRRVDHRVLRFLTVGVVLDVVATGCMIAGSPNQPFTLHGVLGFSALAAMTLDTALAWRHRLQSGAREIARGLRRYTASAYAWWLIAYVTGAVLAMSKGGAG